MCYKIKKTKIEKHSENYTQKKMKENYLGFNINKKRKSEGEILNEDL
jgi:hypothetical protein